MLLWRWRVQKKCEYVWSFERLTVPLRHDDETIAVDRCDLSDAPFWRSFTGAAEGDGEDVALA